MTNIEFMKEIERLKKEYGENKFSTEKIKIFWNSLKDYTYNQFKNTTDYMIANAKICPTLNDYLANLGPVKEKEILFSVNNKCVKCNNTGIWYQEIEGYECAFSCACDMGKKYSFPKRPI